MKPQTTNHQSQTNSNDLNSKLQTRFEFGNWNFGFIWNLVLGNWNFRSRRGANGFGLIEIVIVTAVMTIALFGFLQAGIVAVRLLRNEKENLEATLLAEEALEAVRAVRDESWGAGIAWRTESPLSSPSLRYYPVVQNGKWVLATTSPGLVNGKYNQYVIFERVGRNASDQIVSSGGTNDPETRKVIARATTTTKTVELVTYLTNFQKYLPRLQETKAVFFEEATTDGDLANFPSNNAGDGDPAQSFTTIGAIEVTKVELFLRRTTAKPSDIYVELRSSPTGAILGTSNIITSSTISDDKLSWVEFRFSEPVILAAATTYYIRLRSIPSSTDAGSGSSGTIHWGYLQTASSPYAGGQARRYIGRLSNPNDEGQLLGQYDFGFRVYDLQ